MKKILSLVITIICISSVQAQYVADALKYSQTFPTLSARSMAMGGAFTALGGDFSSTYINPAGLGLYRKSEFVFSPGFGISNTSAQYMGQTNEDQKAQFILGNLGYVGTYNTGKETGLVSLSYALGYNRLNNYNNLARIRGGNPETSLIDHFLQGVDGTDPENLDPFGNRLAFDAYLIDTIPGSAFLYDTPVPLPSEDYPSYQRRTVDTRGGTGEWNASFGMNISNTFYFGMALGFYQLNYDQKMTHTEIDMDGISDYDNFRYTEDLDVEGSGFSMTFGSMVRLFEILRIGGTLHLPTFYKIEEVYRNSMVSEFDDNSTYDGIYAEGQYEYRLRTPLKLQGGASVQIGKVGIISADIEYIDYSNMKLKEKDDFTDFTADNEEIKDRYRSVLNFKFGGEARFNNIFARLGAGFYPSPYASWLDRYDFDKAKYTEATAGFGYRSSSFFFDLGFSALFHKEDYDMYTVGDATYYSPLEQQKYRFIASLGFRF